LLWDANTLQWLLITAIFVFMSLVTAKQEWSRLLFLVMTKIHAQLILAIQQVETVFTLL
jgi:hypothetical protein